MPKKRANGEGSIRKRKDGRWEGRYTAGCWRHSILELTTGLRRGELLALLWTDLDVENMTISVSKQVNRINGVLVVSQPKTPNSIRPSPVLS